MRSWHCCRDVHIAELMLQGTGEKVYDAVVLRRDQNLKLYPSVFPSLWELKKRGTKIVAYTESMSFYSAYRLKRFGLDGVIDALFSPEDHIVPAGVSLDKLR